MLAVKLLGQFVIEREGEPVELLSRPAQALLAYLLLHPHTKTRRERLGGLLWPDATDRNARANLRQTLWRLRKAVGDELFVADKIAIGLNPDVAYTLDVDRLTSVSADSPLPDLIDGVSAFGGPLLPDFYDDWVAPERERLQGLFDERVRTLIRRLEADGRWQEVLEWGECWIALNHAPEPAFRALMRAYAALGDAAGIATAYARCAARLELDLGLEPSEETQALYAQLAGEDWSPPPTRSPYRGLYAFRPEDARYFFGRETFVAHLLEAVREHPLTAVVGPSGSGKSSVVFAGLLPQLQSSDGWQVITFRPGAQPLRALTAALNGTGASARADASLVDVLAQRANGDSAPPLLLVADQFEELYTLVPGRPARREFLDALLGAVEWARDRPDSRFRCVITLRADFMGRALAYRPLADALQRADVKLGPMTREELGRAIVQPAATLGVTFEPGLVERILDDVGQEPGNLPLLEFALAQLWERQARRKLTHDSYEATGRVEGALARHAEDVYAAMDADTRARARQVFVQLVQPGEQTEDTRRVATRDELGDDWLLARQLADSRLVVTGRNAAGQEVAEVAHEALIRNWDRLRGWMEADRTFRAWQERLRAALRQWEASTYDEGALLRGVPLAEAQGWLAERGDELSSDERAYIRASAELQQARQSARDRRRRRTIFGLTAGLALAVALAIVAGVSWRESVRDERAALEAYSLSLSAIAQEALNDLDTATALVIAQAANSVDDPPPLSQRTLLEAAYAPGVRAYFDLAAMVGSEGEEVRSVDLSRDGSVAVAGLTDGTVAFFDPESGTLLASTRAHDYPVNGVLVSPGGDIAVSISVDSRVILWDMQTYQQLRQLEGHSSTVRAVDFNADGTHLLTGGLSSESAETPGELI
ncbi:MAG: BTAD domain-containing putative transcriptional regulator, partial [Anaerolineales bacterium]